MLTWLWNLLIGQFCRHKWEIIGQGRWQDGWGCNGPRYTLQCKKCGLIVGKKLS